MAADLRRGENIDVYVTIAVALVVAVLNLVGLFPASGLTSLVLAVLGLLAIGGLTTRARLDQLREVVVQGGPGPAQAAFPASYQADLTKPGDLWVIGVARGGFIRGHFHELGDRLRAGHEVRVLLVRPGSPGAVLAEQRLPVTVPGVMDKSIRASLELLDGLRSSAGGRLEVRLTDQELAFGAVFASPDTSSARLYLEYYAYKTRLDSQLRMVLSRRDGGWLDHFREQLDQLWSDAEPAPSLERPAVRAEPAERDNRRRG
jgi:hypothetical protein